MKTKSRKIYLVSSCLMGLNTRYDGESKPSKECCEFVKDAIWIPVCPEQLGGLATPRSPAEIKGGDGNDVLAGMASVINSVNVDVSENFICGARQVLAVAEKTGVDFALLKSMSPSCGCGEILGVTAALLKKNGIKIKEF